MGETGQERGPGRRSLIVQYLAREFVEFPDAFGVRAADGTGGTLGLRLRDQVRLLTGRAPGIGILDVARSVVPLVRMVGAAVRLRDELDEITVEEWFDRVGMPQARRRVLWRPMALGVLNELPHLASAQQR